MKFCEAFKSEDILVANATSRNTGAVGAKALVPRMVAQLAAPEDRILDFGAGKDAAHAARLRADNNLNVTAWEFGSNFNPELHDRLALSKKYDIVYASNVINVQNSVQMLRDTLRQIHNTLKPGGIFIGNLPFEPRKNAWSFTKDVTLTGTPEEKTAAKQDDIVKLHSELELMFTGYTRIAASNLDPVFKVTK